METAPDRVRRNSELRPCLGTAGMQFRQGLFHKIERSGSGIHLEIGARTISLDGIAPLRNLPFEFDFRQRGCFRQVHLYAAAGGLDVTDVNLTGQSRGPETGNRSTARVDGQMIVGPLVEPAWRHYPSIFTREVSLLRL